MTKASQLKNNPTSTATPAATKVLRRTPIRINTQRAAAAAKLTHAARVKESTVPKASHPAPRDHNTLDRVLWRVWNAMAITGGSNRARTAPYEV